MLGNINQQKILQERIEAEKLRRANKPQKNTIDSKKNHSNFFEKFFSVKNEVTNDIKRKVVTILGIKMKFKIEENLKISNIPQTLAAVERERERERE
jgi:hypothetical protein